MVELLAALTTLLGGALLPLLRISSLLVTAPILGDAQVPARARILLALALTAVIAPLHASAPAVLSAAWWGAAGAEVAIGLLIGFAFRLVFEGVRMGAEAASGATGLSFAQLTDPVGGMPTAAIGSLYSMLAALAFLALNGHLLIVQVLAESFVQLPPDPIRLAAQLLTFAAQVLAAGVLLAAPVMAAMLGVYLALGAISKAAPALNLFAVGFPAALLVGLIALGWSLNGLSSAVMHYSADAVRAVTGTR